VEIYLNAFLTSTTGGECSASRSGRFTAGERTPAIQQIETRAQNPVWTLSRRKKSVAPAGIELRYVCRSACSLVAIPTELSQFTACKGMEGQLFLTGYTVIPLINFAAIEFWVSSTNEHQR
jgi:hypothetical protein